MNLFQAANDMTDSASYTLSHCFGLAIPHTHENGRADERVLRFRKSKAPAIQVVEEDDNETDTCWLETGKPGSKERIDALRDYYDAKFNQKTNDYTFKNGEKSAFVLTDSEAVDRMTDTVWHWEGEPTDLITAIRQSIKGEVEND